MRMLLEWPEHAPRADCGDGTALVVAAANGNRRGVVMLLEWPEHAPRADCRDGDAIFYAIRAMSAEKGHWRQSYRSIVKTLLTHRTSPGVVRTIERILGSYHADVQHCRTLLRDMQERIVLLQQEGSAEGSAMIDQYVDVVIFMLGHPYDWDIQNIAKIRLERLLGFLHKK
jgi:hypothetical protein